MSRTIVRCLGEKKRTATKKQKTHTQNKQPRPFENDEKQIMHKWKNLSIAL